MLVPSMSSPFDRWSVEILEISTAHVSSWALRGRAVLFYVTTDSCLKTAGIEIVGSGGLKSWRLLT